MRDMIVMRSGMMSNGYDSSRVIASPILLSTQKRIRMDHACCYQNITIVIVLIKRRRQK